jgi:hypothetical protein
MQKPKTRWKNPNSAHKCDRAKTRGHKADTSQNRARQPTTQSTRQTHQTSRNHVPPDRIDKAGQQRDSPPTHGAPVTTSTNQGSTPTANSNWLDLATRRCGITGTADGESSPVITASPISQE